MLTVILTCLLVAAISGGSGYYISHRFWRSTYAAKDTSGDFGAPRGGFFAIMAGALIGLFFMRFIGMYIFPAAAVGPAFITAMIFGAASGSFGLIKGRSAGENSSKKDDGSK